MLNKLIVVLDLVEDGSRLKPLTDHRPLASLPFDGRYRLIDFPFSSMHQAELTSAALFISGSGQSLYDHIRSGSVWGLDSDIGGGVFTHSHIEQKLYEWDDDFEKDHYYDNHRHYIDKSKSKEVLLAGSQILANVDLNDFKNYHRKQAKKLSVAYKELESDRLSLHTNVKAYDIEGMRVLAMNEIKPERPDQIQAGMKMALVNTDYMLVFLDWAREQERKVNAESLVQFALSQNEFIAAYEFDGYFASIEDIDSYFKASMDMLEDSPFYSLFFGNGKVITRPHDGAPTYFGDHSEVNRSHIASNCEIYGQVSDSIIFRNVDIDEGASIENAILMSNCKVSPNVKINYAILDKNVTVDSGVTLQGRPDQVLVIKKGSHISQDMKA